MTQPAVQRYDGKATIQKIAQESGMSEGDSIVFAEKCYDAIPIWEPYGGAESFEEIDTQRAADDYQQAVNRETYALEGIVRNVMGNSDLNAGEKASRISRAATAFEARVNSLDIAKVPPLEDDKSLKGDFITRLKQKLLPGNKEAPVVKVEPKPAALPVGGDIKTGFKMFVDTKGDLRWLSFSSNAFEDHSKELFSTKALQDAIDYSEKMGDRGPLQVFHVPGTQIGTCDFQAMSGRFLVESGTFDNTLMGQKAVQYFDEHPEVDWQVSVGYFFKEHDDKDGTYDWMRIKERSILPAGTADNPYTGFWTQQTGEKAMHSKAKATLEDLFGPEITANVITNTEDGTKALEEAGIRFKMVPEEFGEITAVEEIKAEGTKEEPEFVVLAHEHGTIRHTHRVKMESEHQHQDLQEAYKAKKTSAADAEDAADNGVDDAQEDANGKKIPAKKEQPETFGDMLKLATVLGGVLSDVEGIKESLKEVPGLVESVKALKESDDQRMASFMSTRFTFPGGVRPTESVGNVVDKEKSGIKEIVETDTTEQAAGNYASPYVDDLLGRARIQQG